MRVIEPNQPNSVKDLPVKGNKAKYIVIILIILALIVGVFYIKSRNSPKVEFATPPDSTTSSSATLGASTSLKTFSNQQFRDLYNSFAFPNTKEIAQSPEITGSKLADQHIHAIAEKRGYELRSVVREPISSTSNNKPLQEKAVAPWEEMKKAASTNGINLFLLSGYRSVEDQKALFLQELNKTGLSISQIVSGSADTSINKILERAAPPGYSRHHTGFTIDISCPDQPNFIFARTSCYKWLSDNNYQNTKRFGWIPSYPENTENQGPEPESWEYVWIGLPAVSQ